MVPVPPASPPPSSTTPLRGTKEGITGRRMVTLYKYKFELPRKKLLILYGLMLFIIALGVSLGLVFGLCVRKEMHSENVWKPKVGTTWQYELYHKLENTTLDVDVFDIDVFDTPQSIIDELQGKGKKVVCYFSAGSYEEWRPDAKKFKSDDLGDPLSGWEGERWLDTNSDNVRSIMKSRLDLAKKKKCNGVDPDNVDGYDNKNGLDLQQEDAIDYVNWLADESHDRGLAVGLKNAGGIIDKVIDNMQWCVNEQCAAEDECEVYSKFIAHKKPVFHVEYVDKKNTVTATERDDFCNADGSKDFSTIIKNMNLDEWIALC